MASMGRDPTAGASAARLWILAAPISHLLDIIVQLRWAGGAGGATRCFVCSTA